ncbi:H+/gluconate symporter-like permease [Scopulibacillus darangshiensis]|uniref:H+/gluconate symporter-like permease n=1 Tax=Scopulibacillus darangshiensis TaxID=442528 RepID=A0A4R2PBI2_9BACL|nr:GntP family permease [Scopulibacillus darangshiensis]TCP31265.1 H+/gluconate symporter-like permease [Scopulibacillus darangshiensis]
MLSAIGLIVSLGLLIYLTMRGINIIVAGIICSVVVAVTGGLNLETAMAKYYMDGFTGYFASWFLIFLLGAVFGKVMQDTKAADSIADWVSRRMGPGRAVFAVVAACAIMTYGGVSLFVVGFSVYPIAVSLFKKANLPHRFIPAALVFGSVSFTMTSPGSPEIQNLIPTKFFHTTPTGGGAIGFIIGFLILIAGGFWLGYMVKKAVAKGEGFDWSLSSSKESLEEVSAAGEKANVEDTGEKTPLPNPFLSILPLIMVIIILNITAQWLSSTSAAMVSLLLGILLTWVLNLKFVPHYWPSLASGSQNALVAAANTCAVVGFGSVAAKVPAFQSIVDSLVDIPGPPLVGLAIGISLICAITGSASGGLGIALPILAPIYLAKGLDPGAMHRISTLASGGLDSLPHNGYIVTTIRTICGETHKRSYKPVFYLSVALPTAALILAVILYSIF